MSPNEITGTIIATAIAIHRALGPGLLESVYQGILAFELGQRRLHVDREVAIPVFWKDVRIEVGFRADLVVERTIIVEVKSVETLAPVHKKQVLTYLRLANKQLGLLINFGEPLLKDGIHRIVNGLEE